MNDLIETETGSQTPLAVVPDVATDVQFVAHDAEQMKAAQSAMSVWFGEKVEIAKRDHSELAENLDIAVRNGWKIGSLERQERIARRRVEFYKKCRAATDAGYCIVPNMPGDVFAIRTTRVNPDQQYGPRWMDREQRSNAPPLGDGRYVDSLPLEQRDSVSRTLSDGKEITDQVAWATDFDDVEFPIAIAKPAVLQATAKAMAMKVFDEMVIVPGRRQKGDPIVLGFIRHPARVGKRDDRGVSFLISWWVDVRDIEA